MKTIRQIAQPFGLSRSTLLYYDRRGLLRPEYRTSAGHRLYSEADEERLAQICQLREAGIPLSQIDAILEPIRTLRTPLKKALNRRLSELNQEIAALRRQQQVVVSLLRRPNAAKQSRILTKQAWVKLLTAAGLDPAGRRRWHEEFERRSPEAHQDFLESIGVSADEIREIRKWARDQSVDSSEQHSSTKTEKTFCT